MSMEKKLLEAAAVAAKEAVARERGRILWLLVESEKELKRGFESTVLIESKRHAAKVKLDIAVFLHQQLRMRIASGVHPCNVCSAPTPPNRTTCEHCMLTKKGDNGIIQAD